MSRRATTSRHLLLEIAAARHRGRPLEPDEPVPGCGCASCTGLPAEHPARTPAWKRRSNDDPHTPEESQRTWEHRVAAAREFSLLDVAGELACGDPVRRGKTIAVRCPLHDDRDPSCTLDLARGLWYCFPCGQGGDVIALYMHARRVGFAEAVRRLTPEWADPFRDGRWERLAE